MREIFITCKTLFQIHFVNENVYLGRIMKQHEAVIIALENLGGTATLDDLNIETMKIEDCEWKTKTPFASIRRIVNNHEKIFKVKPGFYSLKKEV